MKAMIFAAGLGTRFKPWTDKHPKALALVNGKTLLERNIKYLQQFGITEVIVNVHHFANQIIEAIQKNNGWGSDVSISDETNEVLETGGGLKKASWYFNQKSFVVINVDILTDLDLQTMINFHQQNKPLATLAVTNRKTSRYFLFDKNDNLCGWENITTNEKRLSALTINPTRKAFSGVQIINPRIFQLRAYIPNTKKFSIIDWYLNLAQINQMQNRIVCFDHSYSKLIDVGKPESVAEAEKLFV